MRYNEQAGFFLLLLKPLLLLLIKPHQTNEIPTE